MSDIVSPWVAQVSGFRHENQIPLKVWIGRPSAPRSSTALYAVLPTGVVRMSLLVSLRAVSLPPRKLPCSSDRVQSKNLDALLRQIDQLGFRSPFRARNRTLNSVETTQRVIGVGDWRYHHAPAPYCPRISVVTMSNTKIPGLEFLFVFPAVCLRDTSFTLGGVRGLGATCC